MKYLRIKIVGHDIVRAFENKNKKSRAHPDYSADGVAVWKNESEEKQEELPSSD